MAPSGERALIFCAQLLPNARNKESPVNQNMRPARESRIDSVPVFGNSGVHVVQGLGFLFYGLREQKDG